MIDNDMLLEYNEYCGNFYGTPRQPVESCIERGGEIVLEVDVNGAANVRKKCSDCFSIFIMPPSFEVLKKRLEGRGTESEEVVKARLDQAVAEIGRAAEYDYIVTNDVLSDAVNDIYGIIRSERLRTSRCIPNFLTLTPLCCGRNGVYHVKSCYRKTYQTFRQPLQAGA